VRQPQAGHPEWQAHSMPFTGWRLIQCHVAVADVQTKLGCHSWRARDVTAYLKNGGLIVAQPKTPKPAAAA
jgi:hypothetical protein